ncbi:MAG: DNA gyrase subunit A [Armatimonadetes bacterium]|jgi:DNA gyrase subunit A|nr:DNA gyrase subunit A [Armatimonadota bacterium]
MDIAKEIVPINIQDEMKQSYLLYSMSVIVARALPDVKDGLKPVQRRILMAMHDLNLGPTAQARKSAKVTGDTSGNYHPHGDQVIYPTIVRMVQPFNSRYPMILGQGNFGSIDDDPPAAQRYTEVRMSNFAMEMLADIDKNTVDFIPNYDNTRTEPTVLPAKFPALLANGASGIAVGMATNIPPHNLGELCDAITLMVDNPEATIEEIMQRMPGPDFPTAGLILGTKGIYDAYSTGRGSVIMQGQAIIEPMENGKNRIIISELPYQVVKNRLISHIADLVKNRKIDGITDLRDESDRSGMRIVIELRRDVQPKRILNHLYKHTPLRQTFGVILLALVNGVPRVLTVPQIIDEYLKHRIEVIQRRSRHDLEGALQRAHILEGLRKALDFIDEVIATIRASRSVDIARTALVERFDLSVLQAQHILDMQLRRLTGLEREAIEDEYRERLKLIAYLEDVLSNPARVRNIIKAELKYLKDKYADPRRTRIIQTEASDIGDEDLIPQEDAIITITKDSYIKRVPIDTYRTQGRGGKGVIALSTKEEDQVEHLFIAKTHDYVLFFTDRGRVYKLKAYEIPQTSRQAMGTAIVNLINKEADENVLAIRPMADLASDGYLVMGTELGEVKRTAVSEFRNLRSQGLKCFDVEEGDTLRWVTQTNGSDDILFVTREGMSIRFPESNVRVSGRVSGGVRGIMLDSAERTKSGLPDRCVGMGRIRGEDGYILVVSERGLGKKTPVSEYRVQNRGGRGIQTMKVTGKTGSLLTARFVTDEDRLLIVSASGVAIRMKVEDIRKTGRSAQGVILQRLSETDSVQSIAPIVRGAETLEGEEEIEMPGVEIME